MAWSIASTIGRTNGMANCSRRRSDRGTTAPPPADVDTANLFHAADIWYSIKQHWCGGARRLLARPASAGLP